MDSILKHQQVFSDINDDETGELIQLISTDEENSMREEELPDELPILPIRNTVLFPGVVIPITVGRQKSIKLVKKAYKGDRIIGAVAQSNSKVEDPGKDDIFGIGTVARILKMIVLPDGNTTIIIQGKQKFQVDKIVQEDPFLVSTFTELDDEELDPKLKSNKAVIQSLKDAASKILKLNPEIPQEAQVALDNIENPNFLTHFLSSNINSEVSDKQKLLEKTNAKERATLLLEFMLKDIQMLELKNEIHKKVHTDIDQQQRDYFLRQQIRILQDELGQDSPDQELDKLRAKAQDKKWSETVQKHFDKELDKISRINPQAAEYPVAMNYVELLLELPWGELTKDNFDLKRAKKILDRDHYGLEKVKERIIEYLAVLKLKQDMKAPILCLYGPPGVGKTSLGKSISDALGRKYVRMSLGGVHDEAEIRGHRKTYVGAMPGKIVQNMKKAGKSNPVYILDEIDKVNSDFRGDPSSALLEVLDPEQNETFQDNYLEVEYDLSNVLFIATANSLDTIHPALRDRMEIIEVTGYTLEEKVEIAKKHLIPKQKKEHGLKSKDVAISKKAVSKIIEDYTRESGVRGLERTIGKVVRNIAKSIAMEEEFNSKIEPEDIVRILGAEVFEKEIYQDNETAGLVTGLAWTSVGGEILFIESSLSRGKGKLTLSGQLGDVMKESAMTALSYLRSHAEELGIHHKIFDHYDLHIHVPAGAVPKDGPSAGIAMITSLASIFTQRKVKSKLAMTGEITLRGKVLPIGGLKEKILAARRAGIKDVILCQRNKKDIDEIDSRYIKGLNIHFVDQVSEVLEIALLKEKIKHPIDFVIPEDDNKKDSISYDHMINKKVIVSLFITFLVSAGASAQIGGLRAFEFLETPNHARVAGLGTVNVSTTSTDVNMIWQNPALLSSKMDGEISFSINPYFADIYNSQVTYAEDFEKLGIFSFGLSYNHYGQFQGFDNTGAASEDFSASDYIIQISHSQENGVFRYGASMKFVSSQLSGFKQSALLTDLGGSFVHPEHQMSVGLVIKNLGFFTSRYSNEDRNLPFDVQLGGTYKPEFMPFRFSLTLNRLYRYDLSYFDQSLLTEDENLIFTDVSANPPSTFDKIFQHITIGTEILLGKNVNLRAGYNHLLRQSLRAEQVGGAGGFTFGVYFQTKKFNLAYSNAIYQAGGFAHFITLGSNLKEFVKKKKS